MEPIITSMLDNDAYKASMQNFVLQLYPNTVVSYRFKNRGTQRFNQEFLKELQNQINYLKDLKLTEEEYIWIKENITYLPISYIEYLKNFRFNPDNVKISLTEDNNLELDIQGKWVETILLEVPLMSIISELYFKIIDTNWSMEGQKEKAEEKVKKLSRNGCNFAKFGSRRRRSKSTQEIVIQEFVNDNKEYVNNSFKGSSNIYFSKKFNLTPIGTLGHEICMGLSVLEGLRNVNYYALEKWLEVYKGDLGIFLPDTYGSDAFFYSFNKIFSKLYDGIRQDSGSWKEFTDKTITHYKKMGINPMSKVIVFSDSLNVDLCIKIKEYCENKILCSFGIGTHFTGDFLNSPALNMVIKLNSVFHNGIEVPVCKLSDSQGKEQGNSEAIRIAKYTFLNEPLG